MKKIILFVLAFSMTALNAFAVPNVGYQNIAKELNKLTSAELVQVFVNTEYTPQFRVTAQLINTPKKCTSSFQVLKPASLKVMINDQAVEFSGDFALVYNRSSSVDGCPYQIKPGTSDFYLYGGEHKWLEIAFENGAPVSIYSAAERKCLLGTCAR